MRDLFRCDYCGELTDPSNALIAWAEADQLEDYRLWIPAVYCSPYCGRSATSIRIGG